MSHCNLLQKTYLLYYTELRFCLAQNCHLPGTCQPGGVLHRDGGMWRQEEIPLQYKNECKFEINFDYIQE